jgi:hypothetical protein
MKPIAQKTLNMIQYFKDHPEVSVAKVAKKFKTNISYTYKIRARARAESWQPPELLDTPETLDDAFGISLKDVPDHPAEVETEKAISKAKRLYVPLAAVQVAKKLGLSPEEYVKKMREADPTAFEETHDLTPNDVDDILDTRATQYGTFADGAALMQAIKRTMAAHAQKHGKTFADDQWEALEMIVHKMARIINGNPDNVDSWRDIAGYAVLIADRLEGKAR